MSYQITEEQKKALLQYSAQTLPDNPSRDGFSAESIRKRMYKPTEKLIDLVNSVFDTAYTDVQSVLTDIQNGNLFARSFVSWSASYTYGADEITFYPSIGTYGAFVQSVVAGNTNNVPYVDGVLNSAYWKEVVNFNTVTEDYFQQVQEAVAQAESAASEAETQATAAAGSASAALISAENANQSAQNSAASAEEAERQARYAINSASAASQYRQGALDAANSALQSKQSAETAAQNAANSATEAQQYAQQAQQYAQKHYQVVASVSELPRPGDSAFIYLVPTGSGTSNDSYSEYLWITESNDYEFIGTTADIDLSNYAQINGTYAGMTVGNATNAQTATNAQQLGGVAAANYAQTNGTYSGMTVGNATQAQNAATADSATSAQDSAKLGGVAASQYALQSQLPVANPTATGTQDLTSLQVGGTVYNIPQGSGGITNAEVIEYADELPTASETSPNFVQTPDGTLYRKKAVESTGGLVGTWVFNDTLTGVGDVPSAEITFTSNAQTFSSINTVTFGGGIVIYHSPSGTDVYPSGTDIHVYRDGAWKDAAYKTIQITDISSLSNVDEFTQWLTANATGGGASVSYEYVAMQEVPTPTTADNGKVLGVTNGAYALQEAGGRQLYQHNIKLKNTTQNFSNSLVYFSLINDVASPYTTVMQVATALASMNLTLSSEGGLPATGMYSAYSDRVMCVVGSKGGSLTVMINTGSTISMQGSPSDKIVDYVTPL